MVGTLLTLCEHLDYEAEEEGWRELRRAIRDMDLIRSKQAAKAVSFTGALASAPVK